MNKHYFNYFDEVGLGFVENQLGDLYRNDHNPRRDDAEALYYYQLGANRGDEDSQFSLADMYYNGQGAIQDYTTAYMYYDLAAGNGIELAAKNRDMAASKMTSGQVARAQQMAREWIERHP